MQINLRLCFMVQNYFAFSMFPFFVFFNLSLRGCQTADFFGTAWIRIKPDSMGVSYKT